MPITRSQNPGGLPQLGWGANASNARGVAAALARDKRAKAGAQEANAATLAVLTDADNPDVPPEANANRNSEVAVANKDDPNDVANGDDPNEADPNPHDRNPPHEVWMGIQVCGAHDEDAARSLAKNPFMSNFSGCLKVTEEDIKDAFKSLEKRTENNIAVEPFIKEKVFAFHCWVKPVSG